MLEYKVACQGSTTASHMPLLLHQYQAVSFPATPARLSHRRAQREERESRRMPCRREALLESPVDACLPAPSAEEEAEAEAEAVAPPPSYRVSANRSHSTRTSNTLCW